MPRLPLLDNSHPTTSPNVTTDSSSYYSIDVSFIPDESVASPSTKPYPVLLSRCPPTASLLPTFLFHPKIFPLIGTVGIIIFGIWCFDNGNRPRTSASHTTCPLLLASFNTSSNCKFASLTPSNPNVSISFSNSINAPSSFTTDTSNEIPIFFNVLLVRSLPKKHISLRIKLSHLPLDPASSIVNRLQ
ncbi:hypothetical protein AX774_g4497 [Zancudomyces culisetae]|uniref:Uncharacterized protein n=1 Tax=Zancudomyces culisetae TaxID=1213189 RepID=A0A1R1PM72_ZANCU|nr:hypothetical protein AX774_g4497 [Zancudomyces culisetae]|eukprot:OMH82033.1 hypothetical protein AX774_g4497 [Zancudomyces culisetae]